MPINLARSTVFNLTGTILPASGAIPTFKRPSAAYVPFIENRGYALKESNIHEPRFLMDGSLLLEPGAVNLVRSPMQITNPDWIIGSQVQVNQDTDLSMTKNYLADKISASAGGSISSHSIYQTLRLKPGYYTLSWYISKIAGSLEEDDRIYVLDGGFLSGGSPNTAELDGISLDTFWGDGQPFENDDRKFKRVVLQFSVGPQTQASIDGSPVSYAVNVDLDYNLNQNSADDATYEQEVTIAMSLGSGGATVAVAGVQLEENPFPTSFIESTFGTPARAAETLVYPQSPFASSEGSFVGLNDWTCRFSVTDWEGDGPIFSAGDVKAEIIGSYLRVTCGANVLNDSAILSQNAQVIIRNKSGHSLRLYVDYELRDQVTFTSNQSFKAAAGPLDFTPTAVRVLKDVLVLNEAVDDGIDQVPQVNGVNVNLETNPLEIPGMLNCLFLLDYKVPVSEGKGRFVFTPITLRAGDTSFVRFPMTRLFSDVVTQDPGSPSTSGVAQVVVCEVVTPGAENATNSNTILEWIQIDGLKFFGAAAAGDGTWLQKKRIAAAALHTQIAAAVNNGELTTVTSTYNAGSTFLTLSATTAGVGFTVSTSAGVGKKTTTPSGAAIGALDVTFPAEFSLGQAYILRDYREIVPVQILSKDIGSGTISVSTDPAPAFELIKSGDVVFQPSWETEIAPGNYLADTLEDSTGIEVVAKAMNGFILKNNSSRTISPVTPLIKMFF